MTAPALVFGAGQATSSNRAGMTLMNDQVGEVIAQVMKDKAGVTVTYLPSMIRIDGEGRVIRLSDVANVEIGAGRGHSRASLDGKPAAALVVYPTGEADPRKLRNALRESLTRLRARLPEGLDLDVSFDFTPNRERLGQFCGQAGSQLGVLGLDILQE